MHGELPTFKRCCFCLPLRRGLIGWGFVKLALDVLAIIHFIFSAIYFFYSYGLDHMYVAVIIFFLLDAIFSVILIVAGHKKSPKLLRVSLIYSITWIVLFLGFKGFFLYFDVRQMYKYGCSYPAMIVDFFVGMGFVLPIIFVQIYVILLIRSEETKLRNQNLEMQFVNNAAEGELRCVSADNEQDVQIVY